MIAEPSSPAAPRVNRGPPIDYGDGLSPSLTNLQGTDITTIAQRRPQHPRRPGRDRSEQLVAIRWNGWSRSPVCAVCSKGGMLDSTVRERGATEARICPMEHPLARECWEAIFTGLVALANVVLIALVIMQTKIASRALNVARDTLDQDHERRSKQASVDHLSSVSWLVMSIERLP
jgi:hypothetical protein